MKTFLVIMALACVGIAAAWLLVPTSTPRVVPASALGPRSVPYSSSIDVVEGGAGGLVLDVSIAPELLAPNAALKARIAGLYRGGKRFDASGRATGAFPAAPGTHYIELHAVPGQSPVLLSVASIPVVASSTTHVRIDVRPETGTIRGVIRDARRRRVNSGSVWLYPDPFGGLRTEIASDGSFSLAKVPEGHYWLRATNLANAKGWSDAGGLIHSVDVEKGEVTKVDVAVERRRRSLLGEIIGEVR